MTESNPTPPPTEPGAPLDYSAGEAYQGAPPTDAEKSSASLTHYLNFIWLVPLIIYLTKKDESPFVKFESRKALNFTLTCLIASFIAGITVICSPLALVIIIGQIVIGIMQGNKLKRGETTKYPWSLNLIK